MSTPTATRPSAILHLGPVSVNLDTRAIAVNRNPVRFPPGEAAMLAALIRHKGRVVVPTALYIAAQGTDGPATSMATVKVQVCHLRQRLRQAGAPDMIGTVWGMGYIAREPAA